MRGVLLSLAILLSGCNGHIAAYVQPVAILDDAGVATVQNPDPVFSFGSYYLGVGYIVSF